MLGAATTIFKSRRQITVISSRKTDKMIISNGNRTEWSPVRSVIIRVINKIGRPRTVLLNCPIKAEIRAVESQSDLTILL